MTTNFGISSTRPCASALRPKQRHQLEHRISKTLRFVSIRLLTPSQHEMLKLEGICLAVRIFIQCFYELA